VIALACLNLVMLKKMINMVELRMRACSSRTFLDLLPVSIGSNACFRVGGNILSDSMDSGMGVIEPKSDFVLVLRLVHFGKDIDSLQLENKFCYSALHNSFEIHASIPTAKQGR